MKPLYAFDGVRLQFGINYSDETNMRTGSKDEGVGGFVGLSRKF